MSLTKHCNLSKDKSKFIYSKEDLLLRIEDRKQMDKDLDFLNHSILELQ